jgi:hypothetical protein
MPQPGGGAPAGGVEAPTGPRVTGPCDWPLRDAHTTSPTPPPQAQPLHPPPESDLAARARVGAQSCLSVIRFKVSCPQVMCRPIDPKGE